jgi:ribosomal protein L11 methyltransferase
MALARVFILPSAGAGDRVPAALFAAGAEAIQEMDGGFMTIAPPEVAARLTTAAMEVDPTATVETVDAPDVDWTTAWRAQLRAHTVGLLTVTPPWLALPFLPERTVVIEPAMAFGTGDHATTRGMLQLMQDEIRAGDVVADLGAGSAVLAIAAARLGATRVAAVENDPDAIGNAELNVAANGVGGVVRVIEGDAAVILPLLAPVRVVLANIISAVIRDLTPAIVGSLAPGGAAIFSGMLTTERDAMRDWFASAGLAPGPEHAEGEWWSCVWRAGAAPAGPRA